MKAVRWHGTHDVRLEDIDVARAPGTGEIQVSVAYCGLCGTDVHEYLHGPFLVPTEPHPVTHQAAPITLGHEISGWVVAVGPDVSTVRAGDLVVLNALLPCGQCDSCSDGAPQRCTTLGHLGLSADGGLAEHLTVPADMAVTVPTHVTARVAALAEPVSVAMHAVDKAGRPQGARCLVIGAGTIGLAVGIVLQTTGNAVTVTDNDERRLDAARRLDFDTVASGQDDSAAAPDIVFECSGGATSFAAAIDACRPGGLIVLCGFPERAVEVDVNRLVLRELRVVGSVGHLVDPDLRRAVELIAAHSERVATLISATVPLDDAVSGGLDVLAGPKRGEHLKILVAVGSDTRTV